MVDLNTLKAEVWRDPRTDCIYVKVCQPSSEHPSMKEGLILRISDEMLCRVAEGQEYPQRVLKSTDLVKKEDLPKGRFESLLDQS